MDCRHCPIFICIYYNSGPLYTVYKSTALILCIAVAGVYRLCVEKKPVFGADSAVSLLRSAPVCHLYYIS